MALGQALSTILDFIVNRNDVPVQATKAATALDTLSKSAGKTQTAVGQLAGAFTGMMAANWIQQGMTAIIKPAADLELSLKNLQVLTGATTGELAKYREEAFRVAAITPYGAVEMVNMMIRLRQATGSAKAALEALEPAAQLAMASFGKLTGEKAAGMLAESIRGFGLTGDQIKAGAEKIAAGTRAMGLGINDVAGSMGKLSIAATRGEQSFDEILQTMLLVRRVIPDEAMAATAVRRVAGTLSTTKTQGILSGIGVKTIDEGGNILRMSDILLQLADRYATASVTTRNAINEAFGERAGLAIIPAVQQLTQGIETNNGQVVKMGGVYDYLKGTMQNAGGTLKELSDAYVQTATGRLENMGNSVQNLAISVGNQLMPALGAGIVVIQKLAEGFKWIVDLDSGLFGVIGTLLRFGSVALTVWGLTAAFDGFRRLAGVINANVQALSGTFAVFSARVSLLSVTMARTTTTMGALRLVFAFVAGGARAAGAAIKGLFVSMGPIGWIMLALSFLPEIIRMVGAAFKAVGNGIRWVANYALSIIKPGIDEFNSWFAETPMGQMVTKGFWSMVADSKKGGGVGAVTGFFSPQAKIVADLQKQMEDTSKRTAEILRQGGKQLYDYMTLGSNAMQSMMKELKGIIDYKPKVFDWNIFRELEAKTKAALAGKGLTEGQRNIGQGMAGGQARTREIMEKAKKEGRPVTPAELREMSTIMSRQYVGADLLSREAPGAGFSARDAAKYSKNLAHPLIDSTSEAGMGYAKALAELSQGKMGGITEGNNRLFGWVPGMGEVLSDAMLNKGARGKNFNDIASMLPDMPAQTAMSNPDIVGNWTRDRLPKTGLMGRLFDQSGTGEERQATNALDRQAVALGKLLERVAGVLEVRVVEGPASKNDPMQGGGGGILGALGLSGAF